MNSVALLQELNQAGRLPDHVIFADTGDEMDEAHRVVEATKALCDEWGVDFQTVRREGPGIVEWHKENRVLPLPHRGFRACTEKFKVAPIRKYLRSLGYDNVVMLIGIAKDESHRMKDSNVKWITHQWPLVYDYGLTRKGCEDTIERLWNGPEVVKSGCKGCPFIGPRGFLQMAKDDPDEFHRWRDMEESARDYPENRLFVESTTLAGIWERSQTESTLDQWERPPIECGIGACSPDARDTGGGAE